MARRAREIADDQARKDEARRKSSLGRRRSTGSGAPPSLITLSADAGRRQSAPAALGRHQPLTRKKQCGQASCGWAPFAPNVKCDACPGEVIHSTTDALCAACHRCLPNGKATHLGRDRQQRARDFVQMCQAVGVKMPGVVVRNFEPNGNCLCLQDDCFHAFFEANRDRQPEGLRRCATCNQRKNGGKWYKVGADEWDCLEIGDAEGSCGGAAQSHPVNCTACYTRKRRTKNSKVAVNGDSCADVVEPQPLTPMERVREKAEKTVDGGGIVDWREAREWLRQAREDDGKEGLRDGYARLLVRQLFDEVAETPDCDARVVVGKRGLDADGDGRNVDLLLFPKVVPDQVVVDLYLRGRRETARAGGAHLNSSKDNEQSIDSLLEMFVQPKVDEEGKTSDGGWECLLEQIFTGEGVPDQDLMEEDNM